MLDQVIPSLTNYPMDDNLNYKSILIESISSETMPHIDTTLSNLVGHYEEKMMNYIYAIPHIPPTLFELKLRHADVKGGVLKMYEACLSECKVKSESICALSQRLSSQIDKLFASVVVKNMREYKVCQTGFIIGWKCNVNKPNNQNCKNRTVDDRF